MKRKLFTAYYRCCGNEWQETHADQVGAGDCPSCHSHPSPYKFEGPRWILDPDYFKNEPDRNEQAVAQIREQFK